MSRAAARQRLPAPDNGIDIAGVELDAVAAPAGALGRDYCRAAAKKAIEYDVAAGRAVEDGIGDHCHRFDGRVQRQQIAFRAAAGQGIGSRIMPDIAAVAPKSPELDVVAVPVAAVLEDKDELVLAAGERAHPGIVLDPDAEVFRRAISIPPAASSSGTWRQSMQT